MALSPYPVAILCHQEKDVFTQHFSADRQLTVSPIFDSTSAILPSCPIIVVSNESINVALSRTPNCIKYKGEKKNERKEPKGDGIVCDPARLYGQMGDVMSLS